MNLSFTSSKSQLEALPPPTHIILASQSIGRKNLLEKLAIRFRVAVSNVDEEKLVSPDPVKTVKIRATAKLDEIINHPRVYLLDDKAKNLVIAADSLAYIGKKTFGKPTDRENAKAIIRDLMGKTHTLVSAVAVAMMEPGGKISKRWEKTVSTRVTIRKVSLPELDIYAGRYDFTRYAAAYSINECPWDFITKIDGSYTNVVGLPFEVILPILRNLEIIV
jgi:septum formation protein